MKHFIFFFFVFLLSLSFVHAAEFSPSSLVYEIEQGKTECLNISIASESEKITVTDLWAEDETIEWRASLFNKESSYHNLDISYDKELLPDERILEVCLSGQDIGEYHGIIVMEEELVGNTIIQMGVWLKVTITEKPEELPSLPANSGGSGSSGGGSAAVSSKSVTVEVAEETDNEVGEIGENVDENSEIKEGEVAGITGAAIGSPSRKIGGIIIAFVVLVIGFYITAYQRKIRSEI